MSNQSHQPKKLSALRDSYLWLTILLSLPAIGPLLQPHYHWSGHDARHSVYFLHQFNQAISDGVWYPRWAPDFAFGYGYPFFNIYGPLSSYVGQAIHLIGFDIVTSVKIVFGLSVIVSGVTMYGFVRALFNPQAGVLAALIYVYLPYHLFDLYVRAALAESVGFVFVPLVLWGFYRSVTQPTVRGIVWAGLAYAGLMFTSNLLALIFTPIMGLYVAYMIVWRFIAPPATSGVSQVARHQLPWWQNLTYALTGPTHRYWGAIRTGFPPTFVLLLGLGISGIFWLPAILEYRFVRVDQWIGGRFKFGDDFVEPFQLLSPQWGFGASIPGPNDEAGFQVGLAALILFMLSFTIVPSLPNLRLRRTLYFFQGVVIAVLFLITPWSIPIWPYLPLSAFAQFPWRLLVVVAPFIAVCGGVLLSSKLPSAGSGNIEAQTEPIAGGTDRLTFILLCSLVILASYPYLEAQSRPPRPTEGPVSQAALFRFQQSSDEMTGQTAWTQRIPNWSTLAEQVENGGQITTKVDYTRLPADQTVGVYSMEMSSVHELLWVGTQKDDQTVTFTIPYYPGWQAYIYEDLGPHDGNLDAEVGPVTRVGSVVNQPTISTTEAEGWLIVPIPTGSHFLEIRFEDTMIRMIGRWISGLSLGLVLLLLVVTSRTSHIKE